MIAENAVKCKIAAFFGPYRARLRRKRGTPIYTLLPMTPVAAALSSGLAFATA